MKYFRRNIWYLLAVSVVIIGCLLIRYLLGLNIGLLLFHMATLVLILGVFFITKSRLQNSMSRQLAELTKIFQSISPQEVPVLTGTYAPELRQLVDAFIAILKYNENWNYEFQKRYNNLLNSHLNQEEKYAQTYTIRYIFEVISRELDLEQLLKQTTDIVMGVLGSKGCFIYILDEKGTFLTVKASSGVITIDGGKEVIPISSSSIIAQAWENRRVYSEIVGDPKEVKELQEPKATRLVIPLSGRLDHSGMCLGIMVIEQEAIGGLKPDLVEFAGLIAQEISLSLENARFYGKMKQMAIHDALTGVYNRMHLINYIQELFAEKPKEVSLIMFDMDFFKRINDQYGHLAGDMVLKTSTSLIQQMLHSGILARYGGEEFVIVLPGTNLKEAYLIAETCRQRIQDFEFITEGVKIPVTFSAGLANYPSNADSYENLLKYADDALYVAKNTGRNKVCIDERKNLSYTLITS